MVVKLSVSVPVWTWRRLRDLAEEDRVSKGRASVSATVARIIEQRLAADKAEPAKV